LATFIAVRVFCAVVAAVLVSLALATFNLLADSAMGRYFAAAFGMIIGWRIPDVILNRLVQRRKARLELGFPDALDMLVICAEAGLGLEQAMGYVSQDMRLAMPEVAEEFSVTEAEMRVLADRRVALENLAARTGLDTLRSLVTILNQSVRFGTPLSDALRQMTAEARYVRM
jgi:tight adherence protein C